MSSNPSAQHLTVTRLTGPSRLRDALRGWRLPLRRSSSELEAAAAQTRAARLFAVNFRHSWTR